MHRRTRMSIKSKLARAGRAGSAADPSGAASARACGQRLVLHGAGAQHKRHAARREQLVDAETSRTETHIDASRLR